MNAIDLATPMGLMFGLLPTVVLTLWSLLVLMVIGWRHRSEADSRLAGVLSAIGVGLAGLAVVWMWSGGARASGDSLMVYLDGYRFAAELLVLFIAMTTCLLSLRFLGRQRLLAPEYYALVLFATIGMQLMVSSSDLVLIFLGLEVMSVAVYVLAGYDRFRRSSAEAALKYFLVGAFASGFLLYGIALTYGVTGQTNLLLVGRVLGAMPTSALAQVGLGMLLIGFGFKVAAVPFHMWAPDVYDGAPTPVTGFMATGVKTAGFIALLRVLADGFPALQELWQPAVAVLAILSIVTGNIVALAQTSMKRLLAYSSIAHAGYLLVALWAASPSGYMAVMLYLWAYSLTSLASFGVVAAVEHVGARTVRIEDLEGLFRTRPWGALSMSVCLLSLLGFPGTFGFIGKWLIMGAALERGQVILPVLVGLGSLVSLGYYLPVIMAMTMKPERSPEVHRQVLFSRAGKLIIAGSVALIIFLGIWPRIPLELGRRTANSMTSQKVVASEQP